MRQVRQRASKGICSKPNQTGGATSANSVVRTSDLPVRLSSSLADSFQVEDMLDTRPQACPLWYRGRQWGRALARHVSSSSSASTAVSF